MIKNADEHELHIKLRRKIFLNILSQSSSPCKIASQLISVVQQAAMQVTIKLFNDPESKQTRAEAI